MREMEVHETTVAQETADTQGARRATGVCAVGVEPGPRPVDSAGSITWAAVAPRNEFHSGRRNDDLWLGKGKGTPRIDRSSPCDTNEEWLVCHTVTEFHNRRQETDDQPPHPILRPHAPE